MQHEINNLYQDYQRSKSQQYATYNQRAHSPMQDTLIGYVADVSETDRLTNSYNVIVPELNNAMLRRVPRKVPGAFSQANGVGYVPPALRPGQPVRITFQRGRTSMPIIDDSVFINGQYENWQQGKFPSIDQKDTTRLSIYPAPLPPETLAVKGDAETKVYPLVVRHTSPTQPATSGTAIEIPGTTYIHDTAGNVYSYFAGQRIAVGQNDQTEIRGTRQSMADIPMKQAVQTAERVQAEVIESLVYWRTSLAGNYAIQSPHPAGGRQRSVLGEISDRISSGTLYSGSLTIPTDLSIPDLPGSSEITAALTKVEGVIGLLDRAGRIAGLQMDFLQGKVLKVIKLVKQLWGTYGKFGLLSLSFSIDLPLNLKVSVSISFDAKTGKLTLSGSIGFGSGTIITGSQPAPLRSEGTIIAGGTPQTRNPEIVVRREVTEVYETTIYQDYSDVMTSDYMPVVEQDPPYVLVSRDLNSLNFAENPSDTVAALLTQYGVQDGSLIVRYLVPLIQYGSLFDFLHLVSALSSPLDRLLIAIGETMMKQNLALTDTPNPVEDPSPVTINSEVKQILDTIEKPAQTECPPLPVQLYQVVRDAQEGQTDRVTDYLENYLFVEMPDYASWFDLSAFMSWLQTRQHAMFPAIKKLYDGSLPDFFVLLIFLKTGVDLRAYTNQYAELQAYLRVAFPLVRAGVE